MLIYCYTNGPGPNRDRYCFPNDISETKSVDKLRQRPYRGGDRSREPSAVHQRLVPVGTRAARDTDGQREVGTAAAPARGGEAAKGAGAAHPGGRGFGRHPGGSPRGRIGGGVLPALGPEPRTVRRVHAVGKHRVGVR